MFVAWEAIRGKVLRLVYSSTINGSVHIADPGEVVPHTPHSALQTTVAAVLIGYKLVNSHALCGSDKQPLVYMVLYTKLVYECALV